MTGSVFLLLGEKTLLLKGSGLERAMAWDTRGSGLNPGWPLTSCVTVRKSFPLSGLSFLICKMGQ